MPPFMRVFIRMSSLEVPEEYATFFPFKSATVLTSFPPITASAFEICESANIDALPLIQSL